MSQRYIRHIPSGILHAYQDSYAMRPDFEDVEDPNVIDVEAKVIEDAPTPKKVARTKKTEAVVEAAVPQELAAVTGDE